MKRCIIYIILCLAIIAVFSCKEHYTLPSKAVVNSNYLVVEGNINVGQDSTIIRLSRVTAVTDTTKSIVAENGATVIVETDAGRNFPLLQLGGGLYYISFITQGAPTEKFRLSINTAGNRQYKSDFVEFKKTPPIDSISWEQFGDGVHVYVNTHDNANKTNYYKWNFVETWEYHASLPWCCDLVNGNIQPRSGPSYYTCWQNIVSSAITLQTTKNLSGDVVYKKQLMFIPTSDYKIGVLYSMLVTQVALTPGAFDYWTALSKNTEQLGSIFDAQPSQIPGNIHSLSDPMEPVVGFISAATSQKQRLWIKRVQVNNWQYPPGPFAVCDTVWLTTPSAFGRVSSGSYVIVASICFFCPIYYATPIDCADCRLKGGVLTKPPFWP